MSSRDTLDSLKEMINSFKWVIVSTPGCEHCNKAKQLMGTRKYLKMDASTVAKARGQTIPEFLDEFSPLTNGYKMVPMVFKDGKFIGGYDALKKAL